MMKRHIMKYCFMKNYFMKNYSAKKYWHLLSCLVIMLLFFAGCGRESAVEEISFTGTILDLTDNGVFVEPLEDEEITKSADWIYFGSEHLEEIGAEVGDIVSVTYTGEIAESYPAQIQAVSWKIVIKSVEGADGIQ